MVFPVVLVHAVASHLQVSVSKDSLAPQALETHLPLQRTSSVGHSHLQLAGLNTSPVVESHTLLTHSPPHSSVSVGHSHRHVVGLKVCPVMGQVLETQLPLQSVVPVGQTHWPLTQLAPVGQALLHEPQLFGSVLTLTHTPPQGV
jgi:hypothetical protein